jgi:protoporphyrinogen/coproporphyrinogen III oxidase
MRAFTVDGGLQRPLDAIAQVPGVTVRLGCSVTGIAGDSHGYGVTDDAGQVYEGQVMALAVPPPVAAGLLGPLAPATAEQISRLKTVQILSRGVVISKPHVHLEPLAGIIPTGANFFSAVSRDVLDDENYRAFTFHFGEGCDENAQISCIQRVLGTDKFEHMRSVEHTLPSPTRDHLKQVASIETSMDRQNLILLGNYFGGMALEDCASRARNEAQSVLSQSANR